MTEVHASSGGQQPLPKVSIGMPVYNEEAWVRDALTSLLAQTYTGFELVISDNASTDGTPDICLHYASIDPRVRYLRQSVNSGATSNFRRVLAEARGRYFMWAAADDRRDARFLELATSILDSNENVGLVFSSGETRDLLTGRSTRWDCSYCASPKKWVRYLVRLLTECSSLIYGLHRKSLLDQVVLEDADFFDLHLSHWYELNSEIRAIPLPLYTAGTKGDRVPYSVTGVDISCVRYLELERLLLNRHFSAPLALGLHCVASLLIRRATRAANSAIRQHRLRTSAVPSP